MSYRNLWLLPLLGMVACSPSGSEPDSAAPGPAAELAQRDVKPTWSEDRLALGKETYELACAICHETGDRDAPITGRREEWEDRSDMWEAVLFEHAKSGYLEMPAKGGQPGLTDDAVEAAAEYMLGLTFPELPRD